MGNYLIKNVVQELLVEFPQMHQFSSLSPIPGFKDWLVMEINKFLHQESEWQYSCVLHINFINGNNNKVFTFI